MASLSCALLEEAAHRSLSAVGVADGSNHPLL